MADVRRLAELGMATELAKEVARQIEEATADPAEAIREKPEVAALDGDSTAADIVAALQA